jgi:hypothetical protein
LESTFAPWLQGVDLDEVKNWYDGYSWGGESVYNPFDILLFFKNNGMFGSYWYATGSPNFLIELINKKWYYVPDFEDLVVDGMDLEKFDIGRIKFEALLFQTGYLTITETLRGPGNILYRLGFPNTEVRSAFNGLVLDEYLLHNEIPAHPLRMALEGQSIPDIEQCLRSLFASIASDNYRNNTIAHYEGYYSAIVYSHLASFGYHLVAEDVTKDGRIDLTLQIPQPGGKQIVYIFEFKTSRDQPPPETEASAPNAALQQILTKNYAAKYRGPHSSIHLIGIVFNPDTKTLTSLAHQRG